MKFTAVSLPQTLPVRPGDPLFVVVRLVADGLAVETWLTPDGAEAHAAELLGAAGRARRRIHDATGMALP